MAMKTVTLFQLKRSTCTKVSKCTHRPPHHQNPHRRTTFSTQDTRNAAQYCQHHKRASTRLPVRYFYHCRMSYEMIFFLLKTQLILADRGNLLQLMIQVNLSRLFLPILVVCFLFFGCCVTPSQELHIVSVFVNCVDCVVLSCSQM